MSTPPSSVGQMTGARGLGRPFWTLWSANALTNTADGIVRILIPLLAVQLTTHPGLVATATVLVSLPWAIASLPVGVLADRRDRKTMLATANAGRVVILLALTTAAVTGWLSLPVLYVATFALGVCEVVADLTSGTLVPMVADGAKLPRANSWLEGTQIVLDEFVGPPLGGLLVALGAASATSSTAGAYLLAVGTLVLLRGAYRPVREQSTAVRADLVEGLRFIWHHRLRRTVTLMVAVMAACWSGWMAVLVVYALGAMQLSQVSYGLLLATLAVGGLLGSIVAAPIERRFGRQTVLGLDVAAGVVMLTTPALTSNVYLVGAATMLGGLGSAMWNVSVASLNQLITPESIRGRASAVSRMAGWGSMPLGAALAGVLASTLGVQAVFAGAAMLTAVLIIPVIRVTTPTEIDEAITEARHQDAAS